MPYIKKAERAKYDPLIERLSQTLNTRIDNDELSGELNYILFRLARLLTDQESGGSRCYARMATVVSAMNEAAAEFRRRRMAPYEDEKIRENGDVA